jgi:hypothetical protein
MKEWKSITRDIEVGQEYLTQDNRLFPNYYF